MQRRVRGVVHGTLVLMAARVAFHTTDAALRVIRRTDDAINYGIAGAVSTATLASLCKACLLDCLQKGIFLKAVCTCCCLLHISPVCFVQLLASINILPRNKGQLFVNIQNVKQ